jgi:hypothetical protein
MRYPKFTAARFPSMPIAALVATTALGGCVGYTDYPSQGYSQTNYPSGYYAGYPRSYSTTYGYRPYYSPGYQRYNDTYGTRGWQ